MSTLTKILIVLMTIASIFLCGIVITYVASANNYKQQYDRQYTSFQSSEQKRKSAKAQLKEEMDKAAQQGKELNDKIAAQNLKIGELEGSLNEALREKTQQLNRADGFAALVEGMTKTNDRQGALITNITSRLENAEAELTTEQGQHKETARSLLEKMAIISTLEETNKRLQEETADLHKRLDQVLNQYGKAIVPPTPVTPISEKARPAPPITRAIDLKGKIANVDFSNRIAEISIGSAQGVEQGMRFHVTRGEQFICDILISDVEPEKAAGRLEVVQGEPRAGDIISTNL